MRRKASGAAAALYASACGSTTVCTSACGRLKLPPSVWHSLWCRPIVVAPSTMPHSQAPYSASLRAARSRASLCSGSNAAALARMPSSAISETTGLASGAYRPSAACAMALKALVTVIANGRPSVSSGS